MDFTIGDIEEGTRPAQVLLRHYGQCLRQLLRSAHWNFARMEASMVLLADATQQTPNVGTVVCDAQFLYEYSYPINCMKARFVPWNPANINPGPPTGNIVPPNNNAPLTTGNIQRPAVGARIIPARWTECFDPNYPIIPQPSASYVFGPNIAITGITNGNPCQITAPGIGSSIANGNLFYVSQVGGMTQLNGGTFSAFNVGPNTVQLEDADGNPINATAFGVYTAGGVINRIQPALVNPNAPGQGPQTWQTQGTSPQGRTVICTNVPNATLVYTALMFYPSNWDPQFRAALVAFLASLIVMPLHKNKQFAMQLRKEQIAIAKDKIMAARVTDGREMVAKNDIPVDWMQARNTGGPFGGGSYGGWGGGLGGGSYGNLWGTWDSIAWADGSAY